MTTEEKKLRDWLWMVTRTLDATDRRPNLLSMDLGELVKAATEMRLELARGTHGTK